MKPREQTSEKLSTKRFLMGFLNFYKFLKVNVRGCPREEN
ncbi:MAG: hypothetical protein JWM99_3159 [Verrucomicrobiales bacterium]|nr:hypothetical protein [Verrucomicrobiales bacterium]